MTSPSCDNIPFGIIFSRKLVSGLAQVRRADIFLYEFVASYADTATPICMGLKPSFSRSPYRDETET